MSLSAFFRKVVLGVALLHAGVAGSAEVAGKAGLVIMHGKGGSPQGLVAEMASQLEARGYLVANLEMPWSGRRKYDVPVSMAENEVVSALKELRGKGATSLFVAGHSQGGVFALYFGGKHQVDGIIAIAPGGNVANDLFRDKLGSSVERARKALAEGRGSEMLELSDYENAKGTFPVASRAVDYLSWFDPEGAMNQGKAVRNFHPDIPLLYIVPSADYPGLRRIKQQMFDALPKHPLTRLFEPGGSHTEAPTVSVGEMDIWMRQVVAAGSGRALP